KKKKKKTKKKFFDCFWGGILYKNVFLVHPIGYTKTITNESCMTVALS
ncbi:hypothetical protein HMPREF9514_03053, partial [Enterococcus faecalis TX0855]